MGLPSNVTKTGFSKLGFSACGHFNYCNLGKGNCYYSDTKKDMEVERYCHCFMRWHDENRVSIKQDETTKNEVEIVDDTGGKGQLSLF